MMKKVSETLVFPKSLTYEEKQLKSKYEILRKLKQRFQEQKVSCKEKTQSHNAVSGGSLEIPENMKKAAVQILKSKGGLKKKTKKEELTKSFKRPSSQLRETNLKLKRFLKEEHFHEADSQTRSVAVRGNSLSHDLLTKNFSSVGEIWNIRIATNGDRAVVTFKFPESTHKAVEMDGLIVEGNQKLSVSHTKKKNLSWKEAIAEERKISTENHLLLKKRTVHVNYCGPMTTRDLRQLFSSIGLVESVYMPKSKEVKSGKMQKSCAFVTFAFEADAERAIRELSGSFWKGMKLIVCPQKIQRNDNLGTAVGSGGNSRRKLVEYPEL